MTDTTTQEFIRITDAHALLGISRPTLHKKLAELGNVPTYKGLDRRETLIERGVLDRLTRVERKEAAKPTTE